MLRRLWMTSVGTLFFVGVWTSAAAAQEEAPPAAGGERGAVAPAAISAESEEKLREAFEHLYNLEFAAGRALFEQVSAEEPESATVQAFWASALLYELLAQQGTLQSQLFVTSNEFLRHTRLPPDPELDQRFHAVTEETRERARVRLEKYPEDIDGLFALGLAYANQANYLAGVKAEYFRGLRLGEKAYDQHKRLRKFRPELHDTGVVLGVREYVIGTLPRVHRFFLFFLGARGSRSRGLRYLQDAARHGEFLRTYAQTLLAVAWIREEELPHALSLLENLRARYPRNPIFMLELAKLYRQQERYAEAEQTCGELLAELLAPSHNPRVVRPEDALLEVGRTETTQGKFEHALESFARVGEFSGGQGRAWAQALLERGKIFDRLGERDRALAEYEKVTRVATDGELRRQARAYRKRPYRPEAKN